MNKKSIFILRLLILISTSVAALAQDHKKHIQQEDKNRLSEISDNLFIAKYICNKNRALQLVLRFGLMLGTQQILHHFHG